MDDEKSDPIEYVPIRDLKIEPEAEELLESAAMKPYMNVAIAMMRGQDLGPAVEELAALPIEQRYTWRIASALKWAFADFDTINVEADRQTLSPEDRQRLTELLAHRPLQFCLFLSSFFGQKQMELMMVSAIRNARVVAAQSEGHKWR
jgi:hypothetical protein